MHVYLTPSHKQMHKKILRSSTNYFMLKLLFHTFDVVDILGYVFFLPSFEVLFPDSICSIVLAIFSSHQITFCVLRLSEIKIKQ